MRTYEVTIAAEDGGPEAELRERWATVAAYRLASLDEKDGSYPEAGGEFDMLDNIEGPFFWEMSDATLEANPPTAVVFEVVSVDPVDKPADGETVRVVARVPF